MRVAGLFKRLLRLERARVVGVELVQDEGGEAVVVELARRERRRMRCSRCGRICRAVYDRGDRRWRHLDLLRVPCVLQAEVRRLSCPECGVVSEEVPWARAGSRFTRGFEDTCVWLARSAPKVVVAQLMRVDWATVGRMIERVVAEHAARQPGDGLDGLRRIGIDEVAYRKGHRYLVCICDHDTGRVIWAAPGRSPAVAEAFFRALGPERCRLVEAVSVDLHGGWLRVIRAHCPGAAICADPFHVIKLATDALDELRRADWQRLREEDPERARWLKGTRFLLRRRADTLSPGAYSVLEELERTNRDVYRGWLLLDQLRAVFAAATREDARELLDAWVLAAAISGLEPFLRTAITLDQHAEEVANAVELGVTNARLEAMNSTVRLMSHRARGFRRLQSLLALITRLRPGAGGATHVNARRRGFPARGR
jgi:transposase